MEDFSGFEQGRKNQNTELDTYICGIVRHLNRLGFYTNGSCDGHGRHSASISIVKNEKDMEQLLRTAISTRDETSSLSERIRKAMSFLSD